MVSNFQYKRFLLEEWRNGGTMNLQPERIRSQLVEKWTQDSNYLMNQWNSGRHKVTLTEHLPILSKFYRCWKRGTGTL